MLSYRHAFHAGNPADILKHSTLMLVLENFLKKEKPFTYIDTHAGAGWYDLHDSCALKTGEASQGIIKILQAKNTPSCLMPYINYCSSLFTEYKYPGSPAIVYNFTRHCDHLVLIELHNTEINILRNNMQKEKTKGQISIHHRNAYEGLPALTPPTPRRGFMLMDPSYEITEDYDKVIKSLIQCHCRWNTGTFLLWYPLLFRRKNETRILKEKLKLIDAKGILNVELYTEKDTQPAGLYGSGMIILNPPWELEKELSVILPWITSAVCNSKFAKWNLEWLSNV